MGPESQVVIASFCHKRVRCQLWAMEQVLGKGFSFILWFCRKVKAQLVFLRCHFVGGEALPGSRAWDQPRFSAKASGDPGFLFHMEQGTRGHLGLCGRFR